MNRIAQDRELIRLDHLAFQLNEAYKLLMNAYPQLKEVFNQLYFSGGCIKSLVRSEVPECYHLFTDDPSVFPILRSAADHYEIEYSGSLIVTIKGAKFEILLDFAVSPEDQIVNTGCTTLMNYYIPSEGVLYIHNESAIRKGAE